MKKFYTRVAIARRDSGFAVTLDDRPIRTPSKAELFAPSEKLAQVVADEWSAQGDEVDPSTMPMTRLVNTALDRVAPRAADVVEELVAYAHTDLLCYRAVDQDELAAQQEKVWQPYLKWLKNSFDVELQTTSGVLPLTQSEAAIDTLRREVAALDGFSLTAFHAFVSGFGSIVLALALVRDFADFEACWTASVLDETHQEALWGLDHEVEDKRKRLKAELLASLDLWHFARA